MRSLIGLREPLCGFTKPERQFIMGVYTRIIPWAAGLQELRLTHSACSGQAPPPLRAFATESRDYGAASIKPSCIVTSSAEATARQERLTIDG